MTEETPADRLLLAWADRVIRNREQVDRLREVPDGPDFYASTSSLFVADPRRTDDLTLAAVLALARPGEKWLDVGAGAGRFALPLALVVREVVAVDPSPGMLAGLREGMLAHGIANVVPVEARWPLPRGSQPPSADVAFIAQVGYDIEAIGPFIAALEAAADRLCAALLQSTVPASVADGFWPPVHGEARVALPGLHDFVALLEARGRTVNLRLLEHVPRRWPDREALLALLRRQLWVEPGGAKDRRLQELLASRIVETEHGLELVGSTPAELGLVTWPPAD